MKTLFVWLLLSGLATAQSSIPRIVIGLSLRASTGEKRAYFLAGETIQTHFQVFNALTHQPDSLDAPLYVDWIDNQQGKLVRQLILKPKRGIARLKLDVPDSLPSGYYQLRAYTNWMRNFSPDAFGQGDMLIIAPRDKQSLSAKRIKTSVASLQVCPEGGALVANLRNKLAVCAKDSFDRPVITSGFISRSLGDTLVRFQTDSAGLATLDFSPQAAASYWVQAGSVRLPLMGSQLMGSVLRCDDITYPDRIRVTVENQYGNQQDTLTLLTQSRGSISAYTRIPMQVPVTVIYLPRTALQEGITTLSLIDQQHNLLSERMIYQGAPPDLTSDAWSWLNAELDEPIHLAKPRQISQALMLRRNTLFSWHELTKERSYLFAPESGITLQGQVRKWNRKPLTQPVTVSLFAQPVEADSVSREELRFAQTDAAGRFRFEGLPLYGIYKAVLTAKVGNADGIIALDSTTIPPIKAHARPIDWHLVMDDDKKQSLINERIAQLAARQQQATRQAGITLQTLTVRAAATPTRQRKFVTPPSIRLDKAKVLSGGLSDLSILFSRYVTPRASKRGTKVLVMVDDIPITYGFELPAVGIVDHIDIHEGTGDAFYYGVDTLVAIYTIFQTGAPSTASPGKQVKLVGFQREL